MSFVVAVILTLLVSFSVHAETRYTIQGLEKPAEIIVDKWGVPHIYAQTHYDAFFVQGFNAARDRLWQIDLWRRRGLGELSEVLGPAFVRQDRAARMFLYRGSMFREWLAYGSDAKRIAEHFTAGINAFVKLARDNKALMPVEFDILGYQPAYWEAADTVRIRSNGLWRNVSTEVLRAMVVCKFSLEVDALRKKLEPDWTTRIPEGLDPCDVTPEVIEMYSLAKAPVDFSQAQQFAGNIKA
ncbi:MAG: penicillin acylase family protein, partial [Pseudomonadales bacterium]|nr:penicillin acylase family protein [Pseudomonadales bacterium]